MNFSVSDLTKEQWAPMSALTHVVCFGDQRDAALDRIDSAIVVTDENGLPSAYMTLIEFDRDTVYIQHGGAFPAHAKSVYVLPGYKLMIEHLREKYRRVITKIHNTNITMLKLAMAGGFLITGVSVWNNKTILELELQKDN